MKTSYGRELGTYGNGRGEDVGTKKMCESQAISWCRRCAAILLFASCTSSDPKAPAAKDPGTTVVQGTQEEPKGATDEEPSTHFYRGYLADVLAGDPVEASQHYQKVLQNGAEEPELAARAAIRLAQWAEATHHRRVALDLAVRASVLGASLPRIRTLANRLQHRLATVRAQDIEVRGPVAGTKLDTVSLEVAATFAEGERLLSKYHRQRLKPRLELLGPSMRAKRGAMEEALAIYREVVQSKEPVAVVAAEFRIASIFYDYSLSLTFELPSELDPDLARNLRHTLRAQVRKDRNAAQAAYRRSLAAARDAGPQAQVWSEAARLGLSSVNDLLRQTR